MQMCGGVAKSSPWRVLVLMEQSVFYMIGKQHFHNFQYLVFVYLYNYLYKIKWLQMWNISMYYLPSIIYLFYLYYMCGSYNTVQLGRASVNPQTCVWSGGDFNFVGSHAKKLKSPHFKVPSTSLGTQRNQKMRYVCTQPVAGLWFFSIGKHEANTTELYSKVRQTCFIKR